VTKKKDEAELQTFRIADVKRPEVRSLGSAGGGGKKGAPDQEAAPTGSVGFPAIERRLENGTIDDIANELSPAYEKLEALATGGDMKARAGAKKAMAAYERTADLFEYLFQTKAALQGEPQK
jgi:hypothetical protein